MTNEYKKKIIDGHAYLPLINFGTTKKELQKKDSYLKTMNKLKQSTIINLCEDEMFLNIPSKNFQFYNADIGKQNIKIRELSQKQLLYLDISVINEIVFQPEEYFYFYMKKLTEQEKDIIDKRSQNYTLEEIGNLYSLTRERIRQLEAKALRASNLLIKNVMFYFFSENGFLDETLLFEVFNKKEARIIKFIIDSHTDYNFDHYTKKIVLVDSFKEPIINREISNLLNSNELTRNDIFQVIFILEQNDILYFDFEDLESILFSNKFRKIDNVYLQMGKVATPYLFVIKKHFKEGIELKQNVITDDYIKLIDLTNHLFDMNKDYDNVRTLVARLTESLKTIDRSIWIHEDLFEFDENIINIILDDLKKSDKNSFYFTEIFNKYKTELNNIGINNRYHLRSAMIELIGDSFETTRDVIKKTGTEFTTLKTKLEEFIFNNKGIIYLDQIRKEFRFHSQTMIYQYLSLSENILGWGHTVYIHKDNVPQIKDERIIQKIISEFDNRVFMSKEDFILLFKDLNNYEILKYYYGLSVSSFLNFYYDDLFSYSIGVIWNNKFKPNNKASQVISLLSLSDDDIIKISSIEKFSTDNSLSYNDSRYLLQLVYSNFIRKSKDEFYPLSVKVTETTLSKLIEEIERILSNNSFTTISEIFNKALLPLHEIYWTPETLASILKNKLSHEYTFYSTGNDKLLTIWGIVTKKGQFDSMADALSSYLIELGITQLTEHELNEFVISNDIYSYGIPYEISSDAKFENKNGIIYLQ